MRRCASFSRARAGSGTTREGPGASSSRRCSAPMRLGWAATSARSAATRPSSERAPAPAARTRPVGVPTPRCGDRGGRALGGPADPRRAGRGRVLPDRGARRSVVRSGEAASTRTRAGERARPERGRDLERGAHAPARLRASGGRASTGRRRAGRFSLADRRGLACADRARRRLDRSTQIDSAAVAYEFKLPDLGEGLTEGEVARWLVSEGDEVAEDQPLVEIQTDKTTVEIPSPAAGKVAQILVEEGKVVPVGTILVVIGEDGAQLSTPMPQPKRDTSQGLAPGRAPAGRVRATPL